MGMESAKTMQNKTKVTICNICYKNREVIL